MSFSVEDLVSSLSTSHIGQEAIDLAALQAQLAQSLFGGSPKPQSRRNSHSQPCNTPTPRTPSASYNSWGQMAVEGQRGTNSQWKSTDDSFRMDDMEEDERMVEELLMPSSPMSAYTSPSSQFSPQSHMHSPTFPQYQPAVYNIQSSNGNDQSLFTSTDPFYIAQLQASQNYSTPQSAFTQSGRLSQNSPFARQQQHYRDNHGYNPQALTLDAHTMLAKTAAF